MHDLQPMTVGRGVSALAASSRPSANRRHCRARVATAPLVQLRVEPAGAASSPSFGRLRSRDVYARTCRPGCRDHPRRPECRLDRRAASVVSTAPTTGGGPPVVPALGSASARAPFPPPTLLASVHSPPSRGRYGNARGARSLHLCFVPHGSLAWRILSAPSLSALLRNQGSHLFPLSEGVSIPGPHEEGARTERHSSHSHSSSRRGRRRGRSGRSGGSRRAVTRAWRGPGRASTTRRCLRHLDHPRHPQRSRTATRRCRRLVTRHAARSCTQQQARRSGATLTPAQSDTPQARRP